MTTLDAPSETSTDLLWLDLTRKCQLACTHCYNASGTEGTHGTMTRMDWLRVLDQAADAGVRRVQLIGGEPTLHPDALALVDHALALGLETEVYSNLVHLTPTWWAGLQRRGARLATSYYSDDPEQHAVITGRRTHALTLRNIVKALEYKVPLRVGVVHVLEGQRIAQAWRQLEALGVTRISLDHARPFGRAADGKQPNCSELCGRCGTGRAAIAPDGTVSPCIMSGWLPAGNVRKTSLGTVLGGSVMLGHIRKIRSVVELREGCDPDDRGGSCDPGCEPNDSCDPGYPESSCPPRN